jgi:tRNA A-37 threonylcarbamoyl transferase component Bud32
MDALDMILKYIVLPVAGFVWMLFMRQQSHHTDIEVLKAQAASTKEAHDREFKEMRESFRRVFEKLDGIEEALRK